MRYVLLGTLSPDWATKQSQRIKAAKAKLKSLGIELDSVHYVQGQYDFVDVVETPNPETLLAFSVWYVSQGFGHFQSMPAFDMATMEKALGRARA